MSEHTLRVPPEGAGKRLDIFILEALAGLQSGFSRTHIQRFILTGGVALQGIVQQKPHQKVKEGQAIVIRLQSRKPAPLGPENIPLDVIYEDDDVAVVNKQAGLVVHPAPGNTAHTLANALLYRFKGLSSVNPQRPGIVHRIDKGTSGILVIAKNDFSHLALAAQFVKHTIKRKYVALVSGKMEFDEGVIELPIGRHPRKRKSMSVGFGLHSKYAKTKYRTLRRSECCSLLELELFTGRTHQIRVHLAFLGHPILGDVTYGKNNQFSRMALHAKFLGFIHPRTNKYLEFSSEPPPEFLRLFNPNKS